MTAMWAWLARHGAAVKFGSAGAALLMLAGGILLGARQTPAPATFSPAGTGTAIVQVSVARVQPSRHSIVGIVRGRGPGVLTVSNGGGVFFTISWNAATHFRKNGQAIRPINLRVGDRVIVIGTPLANGSLHAAVVTVTGHIAVPPVRRIVPQTPPRNPAAPGQTAPRTPRRTPSPRTVTPEF